mmetsp:Transcript_89840/g.192669  ORF Transcript_89840/g.192669 Transcript_89840/m.192669 type:complete len:124 (+) Transcript_89840:2294-2665(+)
MVLLVALAFCSVGKANTTPPGAATVGWVMLAGITTAAAELRDAFALADACCRRLKLAASESASETAQGRRHRGPCHPVLGSTGFAALAVFAVAIRTSSARCLHNMPMGPGDRHGDAMWQSGWP